MCIGYVRVIVVGIENKGGKRIMKKILLILIFLLIPILAFGIQYESITVTDTAIGFTTAKIANNNSRAVCTAETAQMRFRIDGINPTSTEGHLFEVGQVLEIFNNVDIVKFRAIRTGATSGVLKCTYY